MRKEENMKERKKLSANKKEFSYNKTKQSQCQERKKLKECKQEINSSFLDLILQPMLTL